MTTEKEIFERAIKTQCKHEDGNGNYYHPREYCDKEIKKIIHEAKKKDSWKLLILK